ncbi:lipopolysaccharide biosynthesis protein [Pseudonocardia lacus]|uniref:lipopolysaccharide biosynthesis protein n=1 Tax=Pseudonocardia lacus TaxID=2835865 RepID=UPI001BDC1BE2|nr:lipopolysaccharide biosynthesis protein [Pseudonocardia lacus]
MAGGSLTARTIRGFAWAFTGTVSQAVLQIVSMVLLARLLTPGEFGAAAAATLVAGLTQLVSQLGVGPALVQRRTLTDQEVSAAFAFSVALSLLLGLGLHLAAPALNALVGLPPDSVLLRLLTAALLLQGIAAVPLGLLQRHLRFREMAVVDVLAFGPATIGVSVLLAAQGHGAVSIVWGQIAAALVTATGYLWLARPPVRPAGPAATWRSVRALVGFGSGYSLSQVGNWFALNSDNFIVATVLGPAPLGVYNRAYGLLSQPANVIGSAVDKALFPAMSKVRDDGARLRTAYVRAASLVALVTVPASVLLCVLAPEVVTVLLGDGWSAAVVPLQVFAVVLLPRASYKISGSLTRATGAVYRGAWRQWMYAAEVVVGCAIGARWGVTGVAVGASVAIVLHFLVMLRFSGRVAEGLVGTVLRMYLKHIPSAVVVLLVCGGVVALVRPLGSAALTLALTGLAGAVAAAGVVLLLRRWFADELGVFANLRRRGAGSSTATVPA